MHKWIFRILIIFIVIFIVFLIRQIVLVNRFRRAIPWILLSPIVFIIFLNHFLLVNIDQFIDNKFGFLWLNLSIYLIFQRNLNFIIIIILNWKLIINTLVSVNAIVNLFITVWSSTYTKYNILFSLLTLYLFN